MRWLFVCAAQGCIFALSGFIAFLLRFDMSLPSTFFIYFACALPIWIAVKGVIFQASNLNRWGLRYVSIADVYRIVLANCAGSLLSWVIISYIAPAGFPRSICLIDLILSLLGTAGLRVAVRMVAETLHGGQGNSQEKKTLIYGAGDAGITLLREIRNNPKLAYRVCGFLDDGRDKKGLLISGIEVLGRGDEIKSLVTKHNIAIILIAVPSATGVEMTRILELCHTADVEYKTVPGLGEVVEECGLVGQIREVAVEDLLGRNPVRLEVSRIRDALMGKVVLVTGAAGSIGSELCRQIARFQPAGIVGFEIAESPLFEIDREMKQRFPQIPFYPEIGNVQNRVRLDDVLSQYRPAIVYHAAAYKHVPLMETHIFEAVENNVLGTYNLAISAMKYGVEDFVLISSDKAVRPTNIMGTTKRVAELILLALQNGRTRYVAVRFGNVLGSNGSVIPIFKKQIAAGGPVTVTHPEMRRFFMTIPEACQLVLQASAVATGGQICVLDMGQPVKIVDLARNLILLSGLKPEKDIKIQFTGMRPGEKLYEELSTLLEDTIPTEHEKVRIFIGNGVPEGNIHRWLDELRDLCAARDTGRLMVALKEVVLDYSPSAELLRRVVEAKDRDPRAPVLDRSLISHQAKVTIC
ncbi:MAG: nucleoside-diphosphate sugar epimerase/dehydratase [Terracidiphilus sp.]|jgi:FlaA1/EpsC-like NDP-sugar epimerase